ncbi:uncharacterized protein V6R79_008751 [Siganus canaliculatus]
MEQHKRQQRPHLEPIQEETELEDETEGSKTDGEQDLEYQIQAAVETQVEMIEAESEDEGEEEEEEEDEGEEEGQDGNEREVDEEEIEGDKDRKEEDDDECVRRVVRSRRLSRSFGQQSFSPMQNTNNVQEEMDDFSMLSGSSQAGDEANTPRQERLSPVKRCSSVLEEKMATTSFVSAEKDELKKIQEKEEASSDLMVNIEEATTHQLVVE